MNWQSCIKKYFPLLIILFLAAVLRFWNLGTIPNGFHSDEVMNGYVGRFILENGKDLYGYPWPVLYFDHNNDYTNVIPFYFSGLSTYIFGINEFAVRFHDALTGILTVFLVYLLARKLFKTDWIPLLAAFLLAILPWHIVLSRAMSDGITACFVFILAFYLFITSLEKKKVWLGALSILLFLSTYLLYPSFRIIVPLSFLPVPFFVADKRWRLGIIASCILFFLTTGYISQTFWGRGRYEQTSVFTHNNVIKTRTIVYATGLGPGRVLEARIFHNKYILAGQEIIRQYFSYFSPQFLTIEGGKPNRYLVPEHGVLYWSILGVMIITILWHVLQPYKKADIYAVFQPGMKKYMYWLLWIIAVVPLPAALTLDDVPNVHRALLLSIVLIFPVVWAWYMLSQKYLIGKMLAVGLIAGVFLEASVFWHYYASISSTYITHYRSDEQREIGKWLTTNHDRFGDVYVPGGEEIALYYLFIQKNFDQSLAGQFKKGMVIDKIDNINFIREKCLTRDYFNEYNHPPQNSVIIDRAECPIKEYFRNIGEIKYLDDTVAYKIYIPVEVENVVKTERI